MACDINIKDIHLLRNFKNKFIPELRNYWMKIAPKYQKDLDSLINNILSAYNSYKFIEASVFKQRIFTTLFGYYSQFVHNMFETMPYFRDKLFLPPTETCAVIKKISFYTKYVDCDLDNCFQVDEQNDKLVGNIAYDNLMSFLTSTTVQDELINIANNAAGLMTDAALYIIHKQPPPKRHNVYDFYEWSGLDILIDDFGIKIPGFNV